MTLADSNAIIDSISPNHPVLQAFFARENPHASATSVVEVLGFRGIVPADEARYRQYFGRVTVYSITDAIMWRAVALRQQKRMSLGDAFIAATALEHNLTLATRNTADFKHIAGLVLVDPYVP